MRVTVALLNLILGFVYIQYGTLTVIDMRRNWRTMGFSHFGAAWIAMAFTCGPHHLVHGIHMLAAGDQGGLLDLIAVSIGAPAGVIWFALRVEAFRGGQGDRFVSGNPLWVLVLPTALAVYVTALVAAVLAGGSVGGINPVAALPNIFLIVIYMAVGSFLMRTQIS